MDASHGQECPDQAPKRVGMQFVTLCVTRRFCDVSWMCSRLKAPFRPSATDFEGSKQAKSRLR
ncbi:Uncharacterized protein ALO76_04465, partial [Pseudomonas syringae pv. coriandricola]